MEFLWDYQKATGLNDSQLAKSIGVSHATISLLKSGKQRPTPDLAIKVMQHIPDLKPRVLAWLEEQARPEKCTIG